MTPSARCAAALLALLACVQPVSLLRAQDDSAIPAVPPKAMEKTEPIEVPPAPDIDGAGTEAPPIETVGPPDAGPPPAAPDKSGQGGQVQMEGTILGFSALPALQLQSLSETRARPLFRADRRPPAPPPPPDQTAPPPDDKIVGPAPFDYELRGIVTMKSGSIAIISQPSMAVPLRAKVGDILNGWTLKAIEPRMATFENNGEERQLTLFGASSEWSSDENGVKKLTIGASPGVAPPTLSDPSQGVVRSEGSAQEAPPTEPQPLPESKESVQPIRKVY